MVRDRFLVSEPDSSVNLSGNALDCWSLVDVSWATSAKHLTSTEWNACHADGEKHWNGDFQVTPFCCVVSGPHCPWKYTVSGLHRKAGFMIQFMLVIKERKQEWSWTTVHCNLFFIIHARSWIHNKVHSVLSQDTYCYWPECAWPTFPEFLHFNNLHS